MRRSALCLVVAVIACGAPPSASSTPSQEAAIATSASPSVTALATPNRTAAPTSPPEATPSIARNDLAGHIRVLRPGWRPIGRTLLVAAVDGARVTLTAVPIAPGGEPVPFLELTETAGWQLRSDGSALVAAFTNGSYSVARIATVDVPSGAARWVTPDDPDTLDLSPVWSLDGQAIYFSEQGAAPASYGDRGIFRISADGSDRRQVHGPDRNGGTLVGVTPGGEWLVWTRGQAGGSTDVLNLSTGVNKTFEIAGSSGEIAWRTARPRALVMSHGCCAGLPVGELLLWDDVTGATTNLIGIDAAPLVFAGSADWDPSGTRIAAGVRDRAALERSSRTAPTLVALFDASGAYRGLVPGAQGDVLAWVPEGILVRGGHLTADNALEFTLISEYGETSRLVYRTSASNVSLAAIVSP